MSADSEETVVSGQAETVGQIMTAGVVSVAPDDTVGRARTLMLGLGIHGLPVVDEMGVVVGFVTASDLVEEWPSGEPVDTITGRRVVTIEASEAVAAAAELMLDEKVHHLLVTEGGKPRGLVSSFDLLAIVAGRERRRD